MTPVRRGDVWQANLNPVQGSEQAGSRPVLIFQNNGLNKHISTVIAIPFTSNLKRAALPTCVRVPREEGGLKTDSVLLCNQVRVLDKTRLMYKLGEVTASTLYEVESSVLYTMGIE